VRLLCKMDTMLKRNKFIAKIWCDYRKMAGPFTGWRAVYERKRKIYPNSPQRTQSSRDSGPARTPRSPVPASASQERIGLTEITVAGPGGGLPAEQIRPSRGAFARNKFDRLWFLVEALMKDLPTQNLEISLACVR